MRLLGEISDTMEKGLISGIMQRGHLEAVLVSGVADDCAVGKIFQILAHQKINLEFINQIPNQKKNKNVVLCVDRKDIASTLALLREITPEDGDRDVRYLFPAGILSLFPHRESALIISMIVQCLVDGEIPLVAVASSLSSISCVVGEDRLHDALRLLGRNFGLS